MHTFSIKEVVRFSWSTVWKNIGFFVALSLLVLGVSLGAELIGEAESSLGVNTFSTLDQITYLLLLVLNLFLSIWVVRVGINAADARKLSFSNIIPSWEVAWKYVLANFAVALILGIPSLFAVGVIAGLGISSIFGGLMAPAAFGLTTSFLLGVLLVVFLFALIYLSSRLIFTSYCVVDQKLGPIESVKASWRITRGVAWKLIGLMFVLSIINIMGILALLVGLLITIPISIVASAYAYRSLAGSPNVVPTPAGDAVEPVPIPEIGNE